MAACRSCGAEVEWVVTEKGKRMPLDAGEVEGGNIVIDGLGPTRVAKYVANGAGNRVSHFATCPNAKEHRKRG